MTDVEKPPRDTSDHGGASDIQDAWRILAGGTVKAARALVSIAEDTEAPSASRVTASQTILKMTGFGGPDVMMVPVVPREFDQAAPRSEFAMSSAEVIRQRMQLLAADPEPDDDAIVVDAVIVEDPTYG